VFTLSRLSFTDILLEQISAALLSLLPPYCLCSVTHCYCYIYFGQINDDDDDDDEDDDDDDDDDDDKLHNVPNFQLLLCCV